MKKLNIIKHDKEQDNLMSYLNTALWVSSDDNNCPLDQNYGINDIRHDSIKKASNELRLFFESAGELLDGECLEQAAHDFFLTRNRHGAGFWDGDYEEKKEEALTKLAHNFGENYLSVDSDGKIHIS